MAPVQQEDAVSGHREHDALAEHGQGTRSGTARARLSPGEALWPQPGWRRQAEPLGLWSWPRKGRRLLRHIPVPTFHSHQQDEVTPAATTHPLGPVAPDGAEQSSVGTSASPEPKALLESPAQGCHGQGTGMEGGQQDCTPHPRHILWGQNPAPCIPVPVSQSVAGGNAGARLAKATLGHVSFSHPRETTGLLAASRGQGAEGHRHRCPQQPTLTPWGRGLTQSPFGIKTRKYMNPAVHSLSLWLGPRLRFPRRGYPLRGGPVSHAPGVRHFYL